MTGIAPKRSPFFKAVSVLLTLTFLFYNVSFAQPQDSLAQPADLAASKAVISAEDVGIAIDCGTIKNKYNGSNGKIVVHIQDAHCNYEAQNNINRMLDQLTKECGIDIISVEGAEGIVDTTWFKAFPDSEIRKEVATYFMKKGEITGAEFFSITSDFDGTIFGAETRDYYIKNLKSFTEVYPYKDAIEKYFQDTRSVVSRLKGIIYSPELRDVDSRMTAFDSKEIELSAYAEFLFKEISRNRIDIEQYPNFKKLADTLEYEKKIDFDIVDQERSNYIDALSKKLSKEKMTELVTMSIRFKKGHIKAVDFYSFLRDLAKENNINMVQEYPNLFYYYIYTKLYDGIDNEGLFKEIDRLEIELKKKLFKDETQEMLDKVSTLVDMHLDLVNIELTNEDYDLFKQYSSQVSLDQMMSFLQKQCDRYGLGFTVDSVPPEIGQNMPKMVDFYEIAMKRDNALIDNTIGQMDKAGKSRCVLIAGGFHTRGIRDILEKKGISYVVVTPKITKDVETPYIKVLTNQRTSLEDIITESAAMPGMGITAAREEIVRAKGDMLAPPQRVLYTIPLMINDPDLLKLISGAIGSVEGKTLWDATNEQYREMVRRVVAGWLMDLKTNADAKVWEEATQNWQLLMGAFLRKYEENAKAKGLVLKPGFKMPDIVTNGTIQVVMSSVSKEFAAIFKQAFDEAKRPTPGTGAVRMQDDDVVSPLSPQQHDALNAIIKGIIDSGKYTVETVSGLNVYKLEGFEEAIIAHNAAGGVALPVNIVHPGRGKDHTGRNTYLSARLFQDGPNKLTDKEIKELIAHEKSHIADSTKSEEQIIKELNQAAAIEKIRAKMLAIAQEVMSASPVYASARLEGELVKDVAYGETAKRHIEAVKKNIEMLKKNGKADEAAAEERALLEWMRTVQERRANLDRMQNVLTAGKYEGYDVIIVSSSTPDEAKYQQEVLEKLFEGRKTDNAAMKNKVCILSVLDESEGGQIIGQANTWRRAVDMFMAWAQTNGLEETDLDTLFRQDKLKIAVYHNGGKGERASPATQSLGNSRGAQKVVGSVSRADGTKMDIELIPAVILSTAAAATSNNGSRIDTFWANQVTFGTIALNSLTRSNSQFDKFVVKIPATANKKDLFDYGTAVIDGTGRIDKFLANKALTKKDATGKYVDNPDYAPQMADLMSSPNGSLDYGSFSMGRDMHYKLMEYWAEKGIFSKIDETGRAGIARDIDPALVQVVVPLANGLAGKTLPAGLPTAASLKGLSGEERAKALDAAYKALIGVMTDKAYISALDKIYSNAKTKDYALESVEFFLLYPQLFSDMAKVVGSINLGAGSHWFAYKRMLDLSNEKFFMLSDILGRNIELDTDGAVLETPLSPNDADAVRAEDARRMRGIKSDAVATFIVNGELVKLTLEQVKAGWRDEKNDITVKGSIIQGMTVLLPGSRVINSVVNDSQGKIVADHSYIESSTAEEITAINSIVFRASDAGAINANKEIVADAYRPEIKDPRFPDGQTRMRAPVGFDPKGKTENDTAIFGDNKYTFQAIRDMACNRSVNDAIEAVNKDAVRSSAGIVLPTMAAGLSFAAAYSKLAAEETARMERVKAISASVTPLGFGTSGIRGLVPADEVKQATPGISPDDIAAYSARMAKEGCLTDMECYIDMRGFIGFLRETGEIDAEHNVIALGGDLRKSSPRIMAAVMKAIQDEGCKADYVGPVPSPTLAYYAMQKGIPSVMVTGSHIPEDRNGIKFTKKAGEVLKNDEASITRNVQDIRKKVYSWDPERSIFDANGMFKEKPQLPAYGNEAIDLYVKRYVMAFPPNPLSGVRVVVYQHSAVGRDIMFAILKALGADVIAVGRSDDKFIPVDTEKVSDSTRDLLRESAAKYGPFAVISTDGDSDRPLLADEKGEFLPGDKLGALVSLYLGPKGVAVPVSTNSGVVDALKASGVQVRRTKIGSPYVIANMKDAGWEANGGFLLARDWQRSDWRDALKALPTRDAVLPLVAAMLLAKERGISVSELIATALPKRYTHADVVSDKNKKEGFASYTSAMGKEIVKAFSPKNSTLYQIVNGKKELREVEAVFTPDGVKLVFNDDESTLQTALMDVTLELGTIKQSLARYFNAARGFDDIRRINFQDGIRITFANGDIAHIRPSGNAPEFRLYAESATFDRARAIVDMRFDIVREIVLDAFGVRMTPGVQAIRTRPPANTPEEKVVQAIREGKPFYLESYREPKVWGAGGIGEYWYGAEAGKKSSIAVVGQEKAPMDKVMSYAPVELLGEEVAKNYGDTMPLVKILTPKDRLSVQFHDAKNELWIVTNAAGENPTIILGFSDSVVKQYGDRVASEYGKALQKYGAELNNLISVLRNEGYEDEMKRAGNAEAVAIEAANKNEHVNAALLNYDVQKNLLDSFYNYRPVKAGDVIPISAGTLHALGAGVEVVEPQIAGPTQSLEDGATYPVRYFFPEYAPEALQPGQKLLDIGRVGEMNKGVTLEAKPVIVLKDDKATVERLPGGFEAKGLEVHRITLAPGASIEVPVASFHNLVAVEGNAKIVVNGVEYAVPMAVRNGQMLVVPAAAGTYRIVAETPVQIIDTFTPVPETTDVDVTPDDTPMIPGMTEPVMNEKVVFADFPTTSGTFDKIVVLEKVRTPEIFRNRKHDIIVQQGRVKIVKIDGTEVAEIGEGEKFTLPEGFGPYDLVKAGDINAILKVDYEKTEEERIVYATYDAVRKHIKEIKEESIELIVPLEMFRDGGKTEPGTWQWEEAQLQTYVSEKIRLVPYSANQGLKEAARRGISEGAIGILIAPESNIKDADRDDPVVQNFLESRKGKVRVLAIPDVHKAKDLEGKGWYFAREVEGTGLLLASVTPQAIATEGEGNAADDLQKLMAQLTGRSVPRQYLYYMLAKSEISNALLKQLPVELQKDPFGWLVFLVQQLLLKMPIKPFNATEQLQQRRKIMWSV